MGQLLENGLSEALDDGVSPAELVEAMIHTIPYVGIPRPLNSILASKEVFSSRSLLPVSLEEPQWSESERMTVGLRRINDAHPRAAPALEENLGPIAPALYRYIVAAAFGDIYGRPGLSYIQRQPITVVALVTQGDVPNHVRTHVNGALNIDMSPTTIASALIDTIGIVEPEKVLEGLAIAADVFAERRVDAAR